MMTQVRAGLVRTALTEKFPGASYELTDRGRRKLAGYKSRGAGG